MTIQEMRERKRELGLSNQEISRRSGIPVGTLQKILSGKTVSPRSKTIQALEKVLERKPAVYKIPQQSASVLRDSSAAYAYGTHSFHEKKQGEYTLDDYYAIPDERRVELIDGVIYDMAAPSAIHQMILGQLYLQFYACSEAHGGDCAVFLSPCDVQLDNDNKTILQPDLFVLCRKFDIDGRSIPGAPDLTIEILSPSTRSRDMLLKMNKYHNAGVREYWIVDPKHEEVFVYHFEDPDFRPVVYPFDAQIPIHISEGKCSIDFNVIAKNIAKWRSNQRPAAENITRF